MSVPDTVREELRRKLREEADRIGWASLSTTAKSKHYESWTRDPTIGGLLSHYISLGDVRVYLKDTLLKNYAREHLADEAVFYRVIEIPPSMPAVKLYIKPHGRRLDDGRIICWGRANAWKSILMAIYERACESEKYKPYAAVLTHSVGRYKQPRTRAMIENAARKLGIARVAWLEA